MTTKAQWTWLVYMAGDNNLEGAGRDDLDEMKRVGSTADVNVVVQFDTEEQVTTRYRVGRSKLQTVKKMRGVDAGDPKVLTDFLKWGIQQYPATHYLVDVWNHGGGWENLPADFDYDSIRVARPRRAAKLGRLKRSLFRTTVRKIHRRTPAERAIAVDCGSHDYLDNLELRLALARALPRGRKFDVFACDACLMNMFEIAYEMKDTARLMVGSEETEPGAGWPYAAILKRLVAKPSMPPADLGKLIVEEYGKYFKKSRENATQSALDLGQIGELGAAIDRLADALLEDLSAVAGAVSLARDRAQRFETPEYVDLGDLMRQLSTRLPPHSPVTGAAASVLKALGQGDGSGIVLGNVTCGSRVVRASGVSIYFPHPEDYSPDYRSLAFSKEGRWNAFLEALFQA